MKVLAVDHGKKNIGIAISDETGTLARPLAVIAHVVRRLDAARVAELAVLENVEKIIIGVSYDEEGRPNGAGKSALNFMDELRLQCGLSLEAWDESLTTQDARAVKIRFGASKKNRAGHLDDVAAAVLLQSYLDSQKS